MSETEASESAVVGVVIPTWNEAASLPETLASLRRQSVAPAAVVVADGGSTDETVSVAVKEGASVAAAARKGRGPQIAAGLEALPAPVNVVVIGHADMVFSADALAAVVTALASRPEAVGGCLGHRFRTSDPRFRLVEWADRRRVLRTGISYGDQAQFFRRDPLAVAGGFPPLMLLEDVVLSERLRLLGPTLYLDQPVTVSTRGFRRLGFYRTLWRNWRLRRDYRVMGPAAADELYRRYYATTAES